MTKVILDEATEARFTGLAGRVAVCDHEERTLGIFIPVADHSLYEGVEIPFTEDDLKKAEEETESYTTAEVLAYLESLRCTPSAGNE
ncbi:MAG: hypothetical protein HYS12_07980 [Planctomycetes bacterium]|nr:hypothetical protein [Planctomycetota bacterium]